MVDPTIPLNSITITVDELAMEYELLFDDPTNWCFGSMHKEVADRIWDLEQEMDRRIGPFNVHKLLTRIRETLKMVGIADDPVKRWNI